MEKRNIQIVITAKEWYEKGGELKEIASQVFTEKELIGLPKTWEEYYINYPRQKGECYINQNSDINEAAQLLYRDTNSNKNLLPSKEAAEAHLALMQLHQLRDCYRQGWIPEYNAYLEKWIITYGYNDYLIYRTTCNSGFLTFQSKEIAEKFFNNFKDLIIKARDLI